MTFAPLIFMLTQMWHSQHFPVSICWIISVWICLFNYSINSPNSGPNSVAWNVVTKHSVIQCLCKRMPYKQTKNLTIDKTVRQVAATNKIFWRKQESVHIHFAGPDTYTHAHSRTAQISTHWCAHTVISLHLYIESMGLKQ